MEVQRSKGNRAGEKGEYRPTNKLTPKFGSQGSTLPWLPKKKTYTESAGSLYWGSDGPEVPAC